ncbi:MAG: protein-L-isoaspartate(D-aspartate) O-methyltransferase [Myxococcales bacterium]|nr:protein-L-isoaspartate(D-aspartate) O-methyltransferase [Myxococcales bacterium]
MSWVLVIGTLLGGCVAHGNEAEMRSSEAELRSRMVSHQIAGRGVRDARVLRAMGEVPRHEFVPTELRPFAYRDRPLPIGHGQTISQPYIVAVMSELAQLKPGDRVLEVGTGSGYQAAVLAALGAEVYSIELLPELAAQAAATLKRLGYRNIQLRQGDGFAGWPSAAPFRAIVVTAAPSKVPPRLLEQLADGGRLVIPVGVATQQLEVHTRDDETIKVESIFPVRFVPMRGAVKDSAGGAIEPPGAP